MTVMLWTVIGGMALLTVSLVFELARVHRRRDRRRRPTPPVVSIRGRDRPHDGWMT